MKKTTNKNQGKTIDIRMIAPMMLDAVPLSMRNESPIKLSIVSISGEWLSRNDRKVVEYTFGKAIHDTAKRLSEVGIRDGNNSHILDSRLFRKNSWERGGHV